MELRSVKEILLQVPSLTGVPKEGYNNYIKHIKNNKTTKRLKSQNATIKS